MLERFEFEDQLQLKEVSLSTIKRGKFKYIVKSNVEKWKMLYLKKIFILINNFLCNKTFFYFKIFYSWS